MLPASKETHTLVKIVFDDGGVEFAKRVSEGEINPLTREESSVKPTVRLPSQTFDWSFDEKPEISAVDEIWLRTAIEHLATIHDERGRGTPGDQAFCIFEISGVYLQFLAKWDTSEFIAEAVSATSNPELEPLLNEEKQSLLSKLHYSPPETSPNYCQTIQISTSGDIVNVAKLAFMTFAYVYDVRDFGKAEFKIFLPDNSSAPRPI